MISVQCKFLYLKNIIPFERLGFCVSWWFVPFFPSAFYAILFHAVILYSVLYGFSRGQQEHFFRGVGISVQTPETIYIYIYIYIYIDIDR